MNSPNLIGGNLNVNAKITKKNLLNLDRHIVENFDPTNSEVKELEFNKDIYWAEGYLCAITSSPNGFFIKMDDWMPPIKGDDCVFESEEDMRNILSTILSLKNQVASMLNNKNYKPLYEKRNLKSESKVDMAVRWSKGYMYGSMLSHGELLMEEGTDEEAGDITKILFPILFASFNFSDEFFDGKKSAKEKIEDDEDLKLNVIKYIPHAVNSFDAFAEDIREEIMEDQRSSINNGKTIANDDKIGRNDQCPCGSGKKYKKCCLINEDNDLIH